MPDITVSYTDITVSYTRHCSIMQAYYHNQTSLYRTPVIAVSCTRHRCIIHQISLYLPPDMTSSCIQRACPTWQANMGLGDLKAERERCGSASRMPGLLCSAVYDTLVPYMKRALVYNTVVGGVWYRGAWCMI